jgi:predicted DNA-binding transcriptional regulator AlpA
MAQALIMKAANDNRRSTLPLGALPRGFSREQAAEYIGVSPTKWDGMVADGSMPLPKMIGSRTVWDRIAIDLAFDALPDREASNAWDEAGDCFGKISDARRNRRDRAAAHG